MATFRLCSIPGCGKKHRSLGFCLQHYRRWQHHGDPLGGRVDAGTLQEYFNEVVLPYDGDECLIWPFAKDQDGYGQMTINGRSASVSRAVCIRANGPPPTPKHQAAHSCGKGHEGCVTKGHLSWKTNTANQADRVEHGTAWRGEAHGNAKLTEDQVRYIRADPRPNAAIVRELGISPSTVCGIRRRRSWTHI